MEADDADIPGQPPNAGGTPDIGPLDSAADSG
jgi:hypothetical protein